MLECGINFRSPRGLVESSRGIESFHTGHPSQAAVARQQTRVPPRLRTIVVPVAEHVMNT